jgi:hypothetical protein
VHESRVHATDPGKPPLRPGDAPARKARREALVSALAIAAIAVALVPAILDTIETGRIYVLSREFLDDLPKRFTGTGRFRFILQPTVATLLGVRSGVADARAGRPPYLAGLLLHGDHRADLLRSGFASIRNLLAMGIILDLIFQVVLYRSVHPGAALVVGPILICAPYALSRAVSNRVARARTRPGPG